MRLLNVNTFELRDFDDQQIESERYAIASHRWLRNEPTIESFTNQVDPSNLGHQKVLQFCRFTREWDQDIQWLWTDTVCVDKKSSAELAETINSMFRWYARADICFAYLNDVRSMSLGSRLVFADVQRSVWFRRGWTLQELLAPRTVVFLNQLWEIVGHKGSLPQWPTTSNLNQHIAATTGIPEAVLMDYSQSRYLSIEQRMAWLSMRTTSRIEDRAYCMLGIFDISMDMRYGEGEKAQPRLRREIKRSFIKSIDDGTFSDIGLPDSSLWRVDNSWRSRSATAPDQNLRISDQTSGKTSNGTVNRIADVYPKSTLGRPSYGQSSEREEQQYATADLHQPFAWNHQQASSPVLQRSLSETKNPVMIHACSADKGTFDLTGSTESSLAPSETMSTARSGSNLSLSTPLTILEYVSSQHTVIVPGVECGTQTEATALFDFGGFQKDFESTWTNPRKAPDIPKTNPLKKAVQNREVGRRTLAGESVKRAAMQTNKALAKQSQPPADKGDQPETPENIPRLPASSFPHAFERWETLSAHWEGLTSYWLHRLEQNTEDIRGSGPQAVQLARQVTDLSAAGANLFHAVVELQRLRASSERKFQRWFFEVRAEDERKLEIQAGLERELLAERKAKDELKRELMIHKEESRRAWEELGRRLEEGKMTAQILQKGKIAHVEGIRVIAAADDD